MLVEGKGEEVTDEPDSEASGAEVDVKLDSDWDSAVRSDTGTSDTIGVDDNVSAVSTDETVVIEVSSTLGSCTSVSKLAVVATGISLLAGVSSSSFVVVNASALGRVSEVGVGTGAVSALSTEVVVTPPKLSFIAAGAPRGSGISRII